MSKMQLLYFFHRTLPPPLYVQIITSDALTQICSINCIPGYYPVQAFRRDQHLYYQICLVVHGHCWSPLNRLLTLYVRASTSGPFLAKKISFFVLRVSSCFCYSFLSWFSYFIAQFDILLFTFIILLFILIHTVLLDYTTWVGNQQPQLLLPRSVHSPCAAADF